MLYFIKNLLLLKKIPQAQLRQDFLVMKDTLQKIHAGLYTFKTRAEIDHTFHSCYTTKRDSMTLPERLHQLQAA
jgi:hypothetical protein